MVTSILTILKSLWSNKTLRYFILTIVVAILLKVGYSLLTNHYYNTGYQNGVEHQVSIYKKEQDDLKIQYEERLKVKDKERQELNQQITLLKKENSDLKKKREDKKDKVDDEITNYEKSDSGNLRCLDGKWMQLYQDSLPE